jgi:hypothetical protein
MSRKLTAILAIVGLLLFTASSVAPHIPAVQHLQRTEYQSGVAFFVLLFGELIGVALMIAAYTGAIVKVSRLEQNRWLWAMGIGTGLAITGYGAIVTLLMLLAYIAFGPTKPAIQSAGQSAGQSAEVSPSDVEE